MNKCIFLFLTIAASYASAVSFSASERDILKTVLPREEIDLIPLNQLVDSPKHQYRTRNSARGDFNGDGTPDIAICGIKKGPAKKNDGIFVVASFRNGDWRLAFQEKFPANAGPSIKYDEKSKQVFFFLSHARDTVPLELLWDKRNRAFYLGDVDARMRL